MVKYEVHNSEEPLCDSSDGNYIPYKDIEGKYKRTGRSKNIHAKDWYAVYKISYNSLLGNYPTWKSIKKTNQMGTSAKRWKIVKHILDGIKRHITDLELHAGVCMGVSAEDIKTIIDLIKKMVSIVLILTVGRIVPKKLRILL